jgi:hypothetical protein
MRLPHSDSAEIPPEKLRDYLLSAAHPIGRFKSVFFRALGYKADGYEALDKGIRTILSGDAEAVETGGFGTKYLVRGVLTGPNGRTAAIITVWIILSGTTIPRFVTAYPED